MKSYRYVYYSGLAHSGVKGMKWGVRRYQNEDGTLTEEGRAHYGKVFGDRVNKLKSLQAKKAKYNAKASARLKYKIARAEKRATRFKRKSAKVQRKATRLIFPMNAKRAARKMAKYDLKAARAENRAARRLKRYEKYQLKEAKFDKKALRYAEKTMKKFSNIPIDALNKSDVDYVNSYLAEKQRQNEARKV